MQNTGLKDFIDNIMLYGTLGGIGGIAMYLNKVRKGTPFRISMFIINVLVAGWLGIIIKDFIPSYMGEFEYSIISMVGFLAFPILDWIEEKGLLLFIKKALGVKD